MRTYKVYQVDAFTEDKFTGNPAGVVLNSEGLSDDEMLKIARELNNSETAFVFNEKSDDYDVKVRFFTSTNEVPLCGHATISAHYILAKEKNFKGHTRLVQNTLAGNLPVDIFEDEGDYEIEMTQGDIEISNPFDLVLVEKITDALGITLDDLVEEIPVAYASTGFGKVMVCIKELNKLHTLSPDLNKLIEISRDINVNGYHVFTFHPEKEILVHGRMFSPASGNNEDPVTGNANGPLGAYLVSLGVVDNKKDNFTFSTYQGEAMGRPGEIKVSVDIEKEKPKLVKISGSAVKVFETEISL